MKDDVIIFAEISEINDKPNKQIFKDSPRAVGIFLFAEIATLITSGLLDILFLLDNIILIKSKYE